MNRKAEIYSNGVLAGELEKTEQGNYFFTYADFLEFGLKLGIKKSRIEGIVAEYAKVNPTVRPLVERSFLEEKLKSLYLDFYEKKVRQLTMKLP